ncbi:MAG: HK97 gp10 family phage protein [Thalassovita sp.]
MIWCAVDSFAKQVQDFVDKTEAKMDLAVRKIALELFSRVILRSPVDKGRFRANWQVAVGSIPSGILELEDKSGTATVSKADAASAGLKAGDVIYLVNNLPYAQLLEDGSSKQAPAGMVGLSVQEFQQIAKQVGFELVKL